MNKYIKLILDIIEKIKSLINNERLKLITKNLIKIKIIFIKIFKYIKILFNKRIITLKSVERLEINNDETLIITINNNDFQNEKSIELFASLIVDHFKEKNINISVICLRENTKVEVIKSCVRRKKK